MKIYDHHNNLAYTVDKIPIQPIHSGSLKLYPSERPRSVNKEAWSQHNIFEKQIDRKLIHGIISLNGYIYLHSSNNAVKIWKTDEAFENVIAEVSNIMILMRKEFLKFMLYGQNKKSKIDKNILCKLELEIYNNICTVFLNVHGIYSV